MSFLTARASITLNASAVALAWVNAFHATSQDPHRLVLFRTLSVEVFATGVQFIATNGFMLFRTWVPTLNEKSEAHPWPELHERPESAIVVMDAQHFALSFIKAMAGAAKGFEVAELSMVVEDAPEIDEDAPPVLGDSFSKEVLTLRAFGQQMHCQLLEDTYPNWRKLKFGIDEAERVDGMTVSSSMLATIGKLKGVRSVDMTFTGDGKQINLQGSFDSFRGLLMPMARKEKDKPQPEPEDDEQTDALADAKIQLNGKWVPATKENMEKVLRSQRSGRDRAAGKDE